MTEILKNHIVTYIFFCVFRFVPCRWILSAASRRSTSLTIARKNRCLSDHATYVHHSCLPPNSNLITDSQTCLILSLRKQFVEVCHKIGMHFGFSLHSPFIRAQNNQIISSLCFLLGCNSHPSISAHSGGAVFGASDHDVLAPADQHGFVASPTASLRACTASPPHRTVRHSILLCSSNSIHRLASSCSIPLSIFLFG